MKRLLLALCTLMLSFSVMAIDLDTARESGLVGERLDGYLGLVDTSHTEAAALTVEINLKRKIHYQEIANKQNAPLASIEKIAGEKLTTKANKQGLYYQTANGDWVRN
ncbi:YdbL family protein [Oceanobacter sp. 3_MG-2023]|uniref:YdbL family protein n=1 Tax=Oceanobacter sp. 3_MG-2023 TaxID=3062622 RepID=UPI002733CAB4|nr:YdbL family protein [Oceanobacter sp. 3_MG-2023]MDP2505466.1 YdbL family protein [Oceanobacter sp. 3_MG-2023]